MKLLNLNATLGALVALSTAAISASAATNLFAPAVTSGPCPNLVGAYTCSSKSAAPTPMTIEQREVKGLTIYTLTDQKGSSQLPVDNIDYPFDDSSNHVTGVVRFNCEAGAFKMLSKGQQKDNSGNTVSSWDLTESLSINDAKDLSRLTNGTVSSGGKPTPVNEATVCLRKKPSDSDND